MAKVETASKKTTKITIKFQGLSSTIFRDNLPSISDTTEKSIEWLAEKGYKESEIEIKGEKPKCWNNYFPEAV